MTIELDKDEDPVSVKKNSGSQQSLTSVETSTVDTKVNKLMEKKKVGKRKKTTFQRAKKQKSYQLEKPSRNPITISCTEVKRSHNISSPMNKNVLHSQKLSTKSSTTVDKEVEELTSTLPDGWCSEPRQKSRKQNGKVDFYLYSPDGVTISSRLELASYLKKIKSTLSVGDFYVRKIIVPEEIDQKIELPCNDHSTDIKEEALLEHETVKHPQKISRAKWNKFRRNVFSMQKSSNGADSENNGIGKSDSIEHSNGVSQVLPVQVSPVKCAESPSSRPRRSIIRKSAFELLNLPRKLNIEEKNVNQEEVLQHVLAEEKVEESQLGHSTQIEESSKDIAKNCTEHKDLSAAKLSTETDAEKESIQQSSIVKTQKKKIISSSLVKQSSQNQKKKLGISSLKKRSKINSSGNLPDGWKTEAIQRKSGKTAGKVDVYIVSPEGIKFRCKRDLAAFLKNSKSSLNVDSFSFSTKLYS
ncbi:uncharacterized protein LOC129229309 [Uloborus diversus]|uniref:uncharacterized protein LOC129229309 n=1 Tax=Uloborus diversus TaxID=327109 RepID=UPI0024095CDB|nr:uncharacterized protein LOC129229309 [Uloborus diversus]